MKTAKKRVLYFIIGLFTLVCLDGLINYINKDELKVRHVEKISFSKIR